MTKFYKDYFWREGIPYGIGQMEENTQNIECYKIVMDPYRKRICVEKYSQGHFLMSVYDSALLNFRHLNQIDQQSWQKLPIQETEDCVQSIIRDQDDRVLFIETYFFQQNYCKKSIARSPQGIFLSRQEMHYKILGDEENAVILFDSNEHPVVKKIYNADPQTGEFTDLIKEIRDMQCPLL